MLFLPFLPFPFISQFSDDHQFEGINPKGIFANNLLRLEEVDVYGFDYDYTLALYKKTLDRLIYDLGVKSLVEVSYYAELMPSLCRVDAQLMLS